MRCGVAKNMKLDLIEGSSVKFSICGMQFHS